MIEQVNDIKLYGRSPQTAWTHDRSYDSTLTATTALPVDKQGRHWVASNVSTYMQASGDEVSYVRSASSKRTFTSSGGSYSPPGDYRAALTHSSGKYTLTTYGPNPAMGRLTGSRINEFYDYDDPVDAKRGRISRVSDSYGNEITYAYDDSNVTSLTSSMGWSASYAYVDTGSNSGKLQSVTTNKPDGLAMTPVEGVFYVYYDGIPSNTDLGSTGDLNLVYNCDGLAGSGVAAAGTSSSLTDSSASYATDALVGYRLVMVDGANQGRIREITGNTATTITVSPGFSTSLAQGDSYYVVKGAIKITHYRYYRTTGLVGKLKSVHEAAAMQWLSDHGSGMTDPVDILSMSDSAAVDSVNYPGLTIMDQASRSFTYYTADQDTSSVDSPWSGVPGDNSDDENLQAVYGGVNFNETGFVKTEVVQGDCASCGGSGESQVKYTYYYMNLNGGLGAAVTNDVVTRLVVEDITTTDSTQDDVKIRRVLRGFNNDAITLRQATIINQGTPASPSLSYWCESKLVGTGATDLNQVTQSRSSDAHTCVDSAAELRQFLNPTSGDNDNDTLNASTGQIFVNTIGAHGYVTDKKIKQGRTGTEYYVYAADYANEGTVSAPYYRIAHEYNYPEEGKTSRTDASRVTYSYAYTYYDSDPATIREVVITRPAISINCNGSGSTTEVRKYYDDKGGLRWLRNADGTVDYMAYHPALGVSGYMVRDINTSTLPAGLSGDNSGGGGEDVAWDAWVGSAPYATSSSAPLNSTEQLYYDDLGREVKQVVPGGLTTYYVHLQTTRGDEASPNYEKRIYTAWDDSTDKPLLPISVQRWNYANNVIEDYEVDPATLTLTDPPSGSEAAADFQVSGSANNARILTWIRYGYDEKGRMLNTDRYHAIPASGTGASGTNYYRSTVDYDIQGREWVKIDSAGTITFTQFDAFGRRAAIWKGTALGSDPEADDPNNGGGGNMVLIAESFYDGDDGADSTIDVGPGNLTSAVAYVGPSESLTTLHRYDWRNRLVQTRQPGDTKLTTLLTLDNQDRVVASRQYKDTDADWEIDASELLSQTETVYDELGRTCRELRYEVISAAAGDCLATNMWYDARDRMIKLADANGQFVKISYDALGREVAEYVCFDEDESTYAAAADVTGDTVVQQREASYDEMGKVWLVRTLNRNHDATGTGALTPSAEPKGRIEYNAIWYDKAVRIVRVANYGTNAGGADLQSLTDDFNPEMAGTQGYASTGAGEIPEPNSSDLYQVTTYAYDASNRLYETVNNRGIATRSTYDDLGNLAKTVENYVDGAATETETDTDRTTEYVYDACGHQHKIVAYNPKGSGNGVEQQQTCYFYNDAVDASRLTDIVYPDAVATDVSGGALAPLGTDHVHVAYDRQGRQATVTDQRGVVHTYSYDNAGRLSADAVTTLPAGVDDSVLRIEFGYDDLGRRNRVTSHDHATNASPVNEIAFTFDGWGQVVRSRQAHGGATDEYSPAVDYTFDDGASGGVALYNRLAAVTYPSGPGGRRAVYFNYPASGIGAVLSRVDNIAADPSGTTQYAQYTYLGLGTIVKSTRPSVSGALVLDFGVGAAYNGLDRFGRIIDMQWTDTSGATSFDRFRYGYDRGGNRVWKELFMPSASGLNEFYAYDGLDRLTGFERGDLAGSYPDYTGISGTAARSASWALDPLGNWADYALDANGDGDALDAGDLDQSRTSNPANEVTNVTAAQGQSAWRSPGYDAAGNMISGGVPGDPVSPYVLTYDAWNRLTEVSVGMIVNRNAYDGLHRRIAREDFDTGVGTRYDFYYNTNWQILEVRRASDADPCEQYVWDQQYIDTPVVRLRDGNTDGDLADAEDDTLYYTTDANFNVTALVDASGTVVERYVYAPYGEMRACAYNWAYPALSSDYDNEVLYCGYHHDPATGLYQVRNRYYHTGLGRWISRDPLGYVDGMTLYEYVQSNPVIAFDPMGEDMMTPHGFEPFDPITGHPNSSYPKCGGKCYDPSKGECCYDESTSTIGKKKKPYWYYSGKYASLSDCVSAHATYTATGGGLIGYFYGPVGGVVGTLGGFAVAIKLCDRSTCVK